MATHRRRYPVDRVTVTREISSTVVPLKPLTKASLSAFNEETIFSYTPRELRILALRKLTCSLVPRPASQIHSNKHPFNYGAPKWTKMTMLFSTVDSRSSLTDNRTKSGEKRITFAEASDRASAIIDGRSVGRSVGGRSVVDRRRSVGRSSAVGRSVGRSVVDRRRSVGRSVGRSSIVGGRSVGRRRSVGRSVGRSSIVGGRSVGPSAIQLLAVFACLFSLLACLFVCEMN